LPSSLLRRTIRSSPLAHTCSPNIRGFDR
jgi:hypothetical protein